MYLGKFNDKNCGVSLSSPNQSVCLTGVSGTGKTSRMNQMELECVKKGKTVIIIDGNQTHTRERIFYDVRAEYLGMVNRIQVLQDGLGFDLFCPKRNILGEEEPFVHLVSSAVQALSSSQNMGVRQIGALRAAVINAIHHRPEFTSESEALAMSLLQQDNPSSEAVYQKLWSLLHYDVLRASNKTILQRWINIVDLSGLDSMTQTSLAEIVLSNIWRVAQYMGLAETMGDMVIVLDEFQNLSMKKDSVLRALLREGRKFGISLILATQTLEVFQKDVIAILSQTATRQYFRPAPGEARRIAREIDRSNTETWEKKLLSLQVGESIVVGDLAVDNVEIRRPLLLR